MISGWRGRLSLGLGWMMLPSAVWSALLHADLPSVSPTIAALAPVSGTPLRLTVIDAVLGILAHTRWPARPAKPVSLCVSERSSLVAELKSLSDSVPTGRLSAIRVIDLDDELPLDCDAVYLGGGALAAKSLAQVIGRPVLSMGEGVEFCSQGGMFCLVPRAGSLRVEVNLDTVARSGLHVHPQVLKLGQPRPGSTP
jgi:hypothetical protein